MCTGHRDGKDDVILAMIGYIMYIYTCVCVFVCVCLCVCVCVPDIETGRMTSFSP